MKIQTGAAAVWQGVRSWALGAVRAIVMAVQWLAGSTLLLSAAITTIALIPIGLGALLLPPVTTLTRWYAGQRRRLTRDRYGVPVDDPYQPAPQLQRGVVGLVQQTHGIINDPATWRDIAWLLVDATAGGIVAIVCLTLRIYVIGMWASPPLLRGYVQLTAPLLAPTRDQALKLRVQQLTETRADAVDVSAAELRRIERDLHDGAQARLVAMGMSLGAIERLIDRDPDKAKLRVAEARSASAKALTELRDLVHGIHPPVLAERGLGDAVRALALDSAIPADVSCELTGRLAAPVEAAAYFAVSEMLSNAAKHSGATQVHVDLQYQTGLLRVRVTDNGRGGASVAQGTGLRGIERRLATFDGTIALDSPPGGPTIVTMELPCALSSPKTSSS